MPVLSIKHTSHLPQRYLRDYSNEVYVGIMGQKAVYETVSCKGSHYDVHVERSYQLSVFNTQCYRYVSFSTKKLLSFNIQLSILQAFTSSGHF